MSSLPQEGAFIDEVTFEKFAGLILKNHESLALVCRRELTFFDSHAVIDLSTIQKLLKDQLKSQDRDKITDLKDWLQKIKA